MFRGAAPPGWILVQKDYKYHGALPLPKFLPFFKKLIFQKFLKLNK